jgi:hypothetical protein
MGITTPSPSAADFLKGLRREDGLILRCRTWHSFPLSWCALSSARSIRGIGIITANPARIYEMQY